MRALATVILAPGIRYHLLALAFCTVVFAIVPFTIYAHSGEEWGFAFTSLLPLTGLGLILFVGLAFLVRLLAARHAGAAVTLSIALFCLGVFVLLAHVYAPIQIGPLDGSEVVSAEPVLYSLVELILLAASIWIFLRLRNGRGLPVATFFSLALLLVGFGYGTVLGLADRARPEPAGTTGAPGARSPAGASGIDGNVYHVVLDRMQTDALLAVLERSPQAARFEGFELFQNNMANYISTIPSSASYLTGTLYKSGPYRDWVDGWRHRGLLPTLDDRGYEIWMYAPFANWNSQHIDHFRFNIDVYEHETGIGDASLEDLIYVWLASLAPNALTNETLRIAAALRGPLFGLLTGENEPLSIAEGLDPYAGMLMLRGLRRDEQSLPANGRYVYAHAALPHAPFVLDRDCRYVGKTEQRVTVAYLQQAECAVRLLGEFLQELRRLERYDAATIVIHSDTGHGIGGLAGKTRPGGPRTLGVSDIGLVYTLQALLMIKRPHAAGPLRILRAPTQLVDVFPTLLDILDLQPGYEIEGRSVYSIAPDEHRDARFGFDPDKPMNGPNIVEVRIEDPRDLVHSALTVLGPAAGPERERSAPAADAPATD